MVCEEDIEFVDEALEHVSPYNLHDGKEYDTYFVSLCVQEVDNRDRYRVCIAQYLVEDGAEERLYEVHSADRDVYLIKHHELLILPYKSVVCMRVEV
jgi:hypothetical protein